MAIKSATTTLATIQMRRGAEENFDPDQMTAGEWAVSTDTKYVRMCFMPGLCLRMATYEAFEKDMEEIRAILVEAQDIQLAIQAWYKLAESYAHGGTGAREGEETDNAKYYAEQAKISADNAAALADIGIMTTEKAGIGKPDGETIIVDEDGTMHSVCQDGNFASKEIYGYSSINLGRIGSTGDRSIAYGTGVTSSGIRASSLGVNNVSSGANSFSSGSYNEAVGNSAASFGNNNVSVDSYSFSEGCGNIALGYGSHVEGAQNISGAKYVLKIASYNVTAKTFTFDNTYTGFSESFAQLASGVRLHIANINYINDASVYTVASVGSDGKSVVVNENIPTSSFEVLLATIIKSANNYSSCHSEGRRNISLNSNAHSEGYKTEARGYCSHSEGVLTKATGFHSHTEGYRTQATGNQSHAEGIDTHATGDYSHAEGSNTNANGEGTHASGISSSANGDFSNSFGSTVYTYNYASFVCGKYGNITDSSGGAGNTSGRAFCVGGGYEGSDNIVHFSNAFSVSYDGIVKSKSTITASTVADYAEFFEWNDGNSYSEDRVGKFVTLEGNKIKIANSGDYILGIISGSPFVLGNGDCDMWNGAYLRDDFGRVIYEPAPKIELDYDSGESRVVTDENGETVFLGTRPKINPEYDPNREYVSRADRTEWDAVGMIGVLPVRDDGTCEVGKFCKCADGGIATLAEERGLDTYMVIERVTENIVSVILK